MKNLINKTVFCVPLYNAVKTNKSLGEQICERKLVSYTDKFFALMDEKGTIEKYRVDDGCDRLNYGYEIYESRDAAIFEIRKNSFTQFLRSVDLDSIDADSVKHAMKLLKFK